MQTILGAGGVIANELAKNLPAYTDKVKLVSRNPIRVNQTDILFQGDLTNSNNVMDAVNGSSVTYLTVGLKYSIKVWRTQWPLIMKNVINACKEHGSKLVFFDNVYMYGKVDGIMTEDTTVNPCSKKGEVRAKIADMLMDEVASGNITGLIARAADFYGPKVSNSIPDGTIIQNFKKSKKAQLFCSDKFLHSFTYTPDAGKATAILGNTESAYNRIWHLPTKKNPPTGKELVEAFAKEFNVNPGYMTLNKWLIRGVGIVNPIIGELYEMLYQYDRDYIFDSSKFEKEYNFTPTSYEE